MALYFLFNENFLRVRCNGGGNSLLQDGNLEFWLKWFWESQFSGYRNKGWYSLENWPEHANKTASGAVPFPSILKIYGMIFFHVFYRLILWWTILAAVNLNKMRKFSRAKIENLSEIKLENEEYKMGLSPIIKLEVMKENKLSQIRNIRFYFAFFRFDWIGTSTAWSCKKCITKHFRFTLSMMQCWSIQMIRFWWK